MASIADADFTAAATGSPRPLARRVRAMFRLLQRRWRRRLWEVQMRRELGDAHLLADVGIPFRGDAGTIVMLAHAMGGAAGTKV